MPASLHCRAAAIASCKVSPATKRRAMRRVEPFDVTQVANFLLSESFRSVERSMRAQLSQPRGNETSPVSSDCFADSNNGARVKTAGASMFVFFQEFLGINRSHAPRSSGSDRLPVAVILHVASNEHARNGSQAAVLGDQVAVRIHFQFSLEHRRIWVVANGDKNAVQRKFLLFF